MSEQQTSIPPTKALPLNVTGSPIDHTPLGDRVPFTLKSRKMAAFVATMSPEEQEAFEVETAAQQEALRLREKRKARQMMNSSSAATRSRATLPPVLTGPAIEPPTLSRTASEIDEIPYQNLQGRITHDRTSMSADHYGWRANIYVGWLRGDDGTRTRVAIKTMRVSHEDPIEIKRRLIIETAVWVDLDHPNILKFLGLAPDLGSYGVPALVSPYCEKGTVDDYLRLHPNTNTKLFIIKGVASGLQYLHQRDVVHGNLKPSSILIYDDGRALLCGFGSSRILTQQSPTKLAEATRYNAPEFIGSNTMGPNKPTDVYSFAMTCYRIWTNTKPFADLASDSSVIVAVILEQARPAYPTSDIPPGTDLVWKILEDCWKTEAEKRLEVSVAMERLAKINIPA